MKLVRVTIVFLCGLSGLFATDVTAGDRLLFDRALAISQDFLNSPEDSAYSRYQFYWALTGFGNEREAWRILEAWPMPDQDWDDESKLRACWDRDLYWTGMNLAKRSPLSFSEKLTSMAGGSRVVPPTVVAQLWELGPDEPAAIDQDMAALLRFAANYDEACRLPMDDERFAKLRAEAIELAPRALRLVEAPYPAGVNFHHTFHPVLTEVGMCSLAMLSVVPGPDRNDALRTLEEISVDGFPEDLRCSRRGWIEAAELGFDLAADSDAFAWKRAFLETLNVDLRDASRLAENAPADEQSDLQFWRSRIRTLLNDLRTRQHVNDPKSFSRYFQEPDNERWLPESELWRFQMLLILEAARILGDGDLLIAATGELIQQSDRVYDNFDPLAPETSAGDLAVLYHSALRAAERVDNSRLRKVLTDRLTSLVPAVFDEVSHHTGPIYNSGAALQDFGDPVPVWIRGICTSQFDGAAIAEYEYAVFKFQNQSEAQFSGPRSPFAALGACWAVGGALPSRLKQLLQRCKHNVDEHAVAYGAGSAVGFGGCPFGVSEMWHVLEANGCGKSLAHLTSYLEGVVDARNDPYKQWSLRLTQELAR